MLFAQPALAQEAAAWGVNFQSQVFRLHGVFKQVPGGLKQVSVGADGAVWGVDPNDNVLRWIGSQWQQVQGTKLKQLSVRNAQEVWGVDAADDLFRWNGSAWEQPIRSKLAYVSVGADGRLCGIGTDGFVSCRDASTWTPISAQGQQFRRISVTNRQRVLGIDTSGNLLRWTEVGWEVVLPGKGNRADAFELIDAVETTDGELWTVYENGYFMWRKGNSQGSFTTLLGADDQPIPGGLRQIAAVSPLAPPAGLTAEQQQMLDAHNRERQNYPGVGPLQWSPELAQWAQEWAQTLASRGGWGDHRQNQLTNPFRPGESSGENIHWSSGPTTGANAVQSWISEKQWYHYDQDDGMAGYANQPPGCTPPANTPFCGHFTQVIWKNTQYVGCGKAKAASGREYYVCNYYPAGNFRGQKPY